MRDWLREMRVAARSLLRTRGFTAVTVATMALGIGAVTAVFTLVDGVLLSPLPYDDSEALVEVGHSASMDEQSGELGISRSIHALYRDEAETLEELGLWYPTAVNLVLEGSAARVNAQLVTPSFFAALRTDAQVGRTFVESEGAPGGSPVILLSDGVWQERFGGDRAVVGRTIDVDGILREVVGVMPPGFGHPDEEARVWLPMVIDPATANPLSFSERGVGRLAEGVTVEAAIAELAPILSTLPEVAQNFRASPAAFERLEFRPRLTPLKESLVGDTRATLWLLFGSVGFLMLIACVNVANLILVRADGRRSEMALRTALGARGSTLLRPLLSEGLLISAVAGTMGIVVATLALEGTLALLPADLPRAGEIGLDGRVLAFVTVVSAACAGVFGLVPLVGRGKDRINHRLRASGRSGTDDQGRRRLRSGLVVVQMALALVLLIGSGLMLRSFQSLREVDPGFEPEGVLTARLTIPEAEIPGLMETARLLEELQGRLESQPGVTSVGFGTIVPLGGTTSPFSDFQVEGQVAEDGDLPTAVSHNWVSPGFLEAVGVELVEGRFLEASDRAGEARSVVVSRQVAERYWPGESALGRRIRLGFPEGEGWYSVVGVVADVHYQSLSEDPEERVYWPWLYGLDASPSVQRSQAVVVRTDADPLAFVPVLQRELRDLNPRIALSSIRSLDEIHASATATTSFAAAVIGAASAIALLLGLVGIYGVISCVVSQRSREFGVRMALGATGRAIRTMVVRQGIVLATFGTGFGLLIGWAVSSTMQSLLYGIVGIDPISYAVATAVLLALAAAASWIAALRASGIEPTRALRAE